VTCMVSIFLVMFIAPFVKNYPYDMSFSTQFIQNALFNQAILGVYENSIFVAFASAAVGTVIAYSSAIINVRTAMGRKAKVSLDLLSMITNTTPGMVLGLSYLMLFNDSGFKGTFLVLILCNIVHFFTTPYLMAKNSLAKLNPAWETTGELMGDTWIKTVWRIIFPTPAATIRGNVRLFFINAMVTISAIIFLVTARTAVVTSKIKELQHFASFNEIFVLSILIFVTNIIVKIGCDIVQQKIVIFSRQVTIKYRYIYSIWRESAKMNKVSKNLALCLIVIAMMTGLAGCGGSNAPGKSPEPAKKVVIYTNADKEATDAMEKSLKEAGYEGKYVLQTLGTSELGGKLMAEGDKIEANLVTMSSYFLDSAQNKYKMFADLTFDTKAMIKHPAYYAPILANTGAIFVNTQVLKEKNLPMPKSVKDLTQDQFKDQVSIPNIMNSSTAWLLIQSIISQYGEVEGKAVLSKLIQNSGPHIEKSGSGPIKKVRAGEVAAGFGLRHQAVADKASGKPIDYVDPVEGNYSLTEAVAVVKKQMRQQPSLPWTWPK